VAVHPGEPTEVTLRRDLAVAVACGLTVLVLGSVRFQLPGIPGAITDLSGLGLFAAAFHLRRGGLTLLVAASTILVTPAEGSAASTFAMHAVGTPLAWAVARWLLRRELFAPLLGLAWGGFVVVGYYAATVAPILLVTNAMAGLLPWEGLAARYLPLLESLRWEIMTIGALTSLHLVNLREARLRRGATERLRASEARLAGILAAAPVGLALLRGGRVEWANEKLGALAGRPARELAGRALVELFAPGPGEDDVEPAALLARVMGEGRPAEAELHLRGTGEVERVALVHLAAVPGEDPSAIALSALDVTERVRLEGQLRGAQKMEALGHVAGGVAHDFGQLLLVLSISRTEVVAALGKGRPVDAILVRAGEAIEQGWRMVRQLTAFARRQPTAPVEVDLAEVVERMAGVLQTAVGQSIQLTHVRTPGVPTVHADPSQLEQVLMNLVINARDAIDARAAGPRRLEIRVVPSDAAHGEPPGGAVLEVLDTGTGMDHAVRARLFEPFFTTKPEGTGSGLGLATVYGIVEKHGGRLTVESTPGEGTTFRAAFPSRAERA